MPSDLRRRDTCRLCESQAFELALHLTPTPVADAYVSEGELSEPQDVYPVDIYQCQQKKA